MAAPQQGGQSDNSAGIIWVVVGLFAVLGIVWYIYKSYLIRFYLSIKFYELAFLNLITGGHYDSLKMSYLSALAMPEKLGLQDMLVLGASVGSVYRYPITLALFALAVLVYLSNTTRVFKRTYSMKDLAKLEKNNWPQITPIVDLDLVKDDIDKGPWAMAMTPMQFCKRFKLLEEVRPQRREGMSRRDWDKVEVVLRRGEANRLFALQLGQMWRGTDKLPLYIRALFAVFAARINADSKDAAKMLAQLSATSTTKLDFTGVDELCNKHVNTKLVQQIVQSHAYVHTVMAAMLLGSRDDGVQASADFLWLKPLDRRLWYTLNTVGRQTPFVEVAGIFAHWVAEREAGRKLIVPMVEEATKALELALKEVVYRPDESK